MYRSSCHAYNKAYLCFGTVLFHWLTFIFHEASIFTKIQSLCLVLLIFENVLNVKWDIREYTIYDWKFQNTYRSLQLVISFARVLKTSCSQINTFVVFIIINSRIFLQCQYPIGTSIVIFKITNYNYRFTLGLSRIHHDVCRVIFIFIF